MVSKWCKSWILINKSFSWTMRSLGPRASQPNWMRLARLRCPGSRWSIHLRNHWAPKAVNTKFKVMNVCFLNTTDRSTWRHGNHVSALWNNCQYDKKCHMITHFLWTRKLQTSAFYFALQCKSKLTIHLLSLSESQWCDFLNQIDCNKENNVILDIRKFFLIVLAKRIVWFGKNFKHHT